MCNLALLCGIIIDDQFVSSINTYAMDIIILLLNIDIIANKYTYLEQW